MATGEDLEPTPTTQKVIEEPRKSKSTTKNWTKVKVNKETLPLKITLFLYYGAMAAILPYVTIHMQSIGISITEVAVIYAVLPFTSFLGPPFLGFLADRFGDYKWVLILATFCNGLFHTLLLFVPQYQAVQSIQYPLGVHWNTDLNTGHVTPLDLKHCPVVQTPAFKSALTHLTLFYSLRSTTFDQNDTQVQTLTGCTAPLGLETRVVMDTRSVRDDLYFTTDLTVVTVGYGSNQVTFWLYFGLRIIATMFMSSCFSLLDATTLALVKRCGKAEYGKERVWSIIGSAITSPIAGILVDRLSNGKERVDYSSAFYLCDGLLACSIICFFLIKLEVDKPEKGILRNAVKLFKYPEVVIFLVMIYFLGNFWGFVESYLFIFLKELHAPNYLLGLTLTCGSLMGVPFLWGSEKIVAKFGRVNLIIAAFFTYFVRFFGYSYLQDPFWCFPFEAMEALTYHLFWVAAATYCSLLAPKGMLASLMGIMGSLHYSLGKGAGSFFGGITYGLAGARHSFRFFGIAAGVMGVIFFLIDYTCIRKLVARRLQEAKDIEASGPVLQERCKRGSIFDSNPIVGMGTVLDLDADEDDGGRDDEDESRKENTVDEKMLKNSNS